jgi:hypothetical protein
VQVDPIEPDAATSDFWEERQARVDALRESLRPENR